MRPLQILDMIGRSGAKDTYHGDGVGVGGGQRVPLHRDLTGRTGIGAVVAGLAGLIGAHGPTGILLIGGDGDQTSISRELALSALLLESSVLRNGASLLVANMGVAMAMTGRLSAGNEGDKRGSAGQRNVELHCVERV